MRQTDDRSAPSGGRRRPAAAGRPTIRQIAEAAGVSRGTVDRALNERGDVNPQVARRIRQLADDLGYAPHRAARALRLNHTPQTIGVLLPRTSSNFFAQIEAGIRESESHFADMGIHAAVCGFDPEDEKALTALVRGARDDGVAGLIMTGPDTDHVRSAVRDLVAADIPVITTNSDITRSGRLAFVGQDLRRSGEVAAELMGKLIAPRARNGHPAAGRIVILTGSMDFQAHRDRVDGFTSALARWAPGIATEVLEGHDSYEESIRVLERIDRRGIVGAYAATGSIRALLEQRRSWEHPDRVRVVTNDDLPVVRDGLRSGEIDFTILQDARFQGTEPMRLLAELLLSNQKPGEEWIRAPIIVAGQTLIE